MRHLRLLTSACVLASASLVSSSFAQDAFRARQYSGPLESQDICTADFNSDGLADIATADGYNSVFTLLFGSSTGLSGPLQITTNSGGVVSGICTADFDGDTLPDIAVSIRDYDVVEIFLNTGGNFAYFATHSVGSSPIRIEAGKLNSQDTNADLAILCQGGYEVWVLMGDGTGGVLATSQVLPFGSTGSSGFTDMSLGDLNADGILDCAVSMPHVEQVWLGTNDGSGNFVTSGTITLVPVVVSDVQAQSIAIGDYDNDGNGDVFVLANHNQRVEVYQGDGNGGVVGLTITKDEGAFWDGWKLIVDDINNDGLLDFAVGHTNDVELHLYYQNGGTFGGGVYEPWLPASPGNFGMVFADVDGDGDRDCAAPSSGFSGITLIKASLPGVFEVPNDAYASPVTDSVALADLDMDGNCDIVTCDEGADRVLLTYTDGNGNLVSFFDAPTVAGSPWHIEAADFDADGKPDLVTANKSSNDIAVLFNLGGTGNFSVPSHTNAGSEPRYLAVADVNLDGNPDVVVANSLSSDISVLLGTGLGNFTSAGSVAIGGEPYGVEVGDLSENGFPELVVADKASGLVAVCENLSNGVFGSPANYIIGVPTTSGTIAVAIGDVDNDLRLDVAAVGNFDNSLTVFKGDGTGALVSNTSYTIGWAPTHVVLADVSGDGMLDAAVVHHGIESRNLGIITNDTAGGFGLPMVTYGMYNRQSYSKMELEAADLNSDGMMDIVCANGLFASVYMNQRTQPNGLGLSLTGTPGCQGRIGMSAIGAPQVNTPNYGFTVTNAPPRSLGLGIVVDVPDLVGSDPFGIFVTFHVDFIFSNEIIPLDIISDMVGGAFVPVAIPNNPNIVNMTFYLQSLWVFNPAAPCDPSPLGASTSRLLDITILP
ncbi:MAG: FG-GAP repeat domain-containing protein [Planctomycetota bacterium]